MEEKGLEVFCGNGFKKGGLLVLGFLYLLERKTEREIDFKINYILLKDT